MNRLLLIAMFAGLTIVAIGRAQEADKGEFEKLSQRYQSVVDRRPSRGTGFDLLFRHYLEAGRLDDLAAVYEAKVDAAPDDSASLLVLGLIYERRGDTDRALEQFQRAAEADPGNYRPHYYLGQLYARQSQPDEAIAEYRRAIQQPVARTDLLDVHRQLGRLLARQGKVDEALEVWSSLSEKFPDDPFVTEELAVLLANENQFDAAIAQYDRLMAMSKSNQNRRIAAQVAIGELQIRQNRQDAALATFEAALERLQPESWVARDIRGRIEGVFERNRNLKGLVSYYRTRIEKKPDDLESRLRLAAVLMRLSDDDAALKEYRQILELAPSRADVRADYRDALAAADRLSEAAAQAKVLASQNPTDIDLLQRLGTLSLQAAGKDRDRGERDALAAWSQIVRIRPEDPLLAVQAAELCREAARIPSALGGEEAGEGILQKAKSVLGRAALDFYRDAVKRDPASPRFREYLGEYLFSTGSREEAVAQWRTMAEPPRDSAANFRRLAEVFRSAELPEEAAKAIDAALARDADNLENHRFAASLRAELGDMERAAVHLDQVEELSETPEQIERALLQRVEAYQATGQLAAEATRLQKRLAAGEGKARDYWLAGMMSAAQRRTTESLAFLERAVASDPENIPLRLAKAEIHHQAGDLAGGVDQYRELARIDPRRRLEALRKVVELEMQLGRFDAARLDAEELVRAFPGMPGVVFELADVHVRAGDPKSAIDVLRQAVQSYPQEVELRLRLAGQLAEADEYNEAIEHLWRAFELTSETSDKLTIVPRLAEDYQAVDRFSELIDRLDQIRVEDDDPSLPLLCQVKARTAIGDDRACLDDLEALLIRHPDDPNVLAELAAVSKRLGRLPEAAVYQERLAGVTGSETALEELAVLYEIMKNVEDAERIWNEMVEQSADVEAAIRTLDRAEDDGAYRRVMPAAERLWARHPQDWRLGARVMIYRWAAGKYAAADETAAQLLELTSGSTSVRTVAAPRSSYGGDPPLIERFGLPDEILSRLESRGMDDLRGWSSWETFGDLQDVHLVSTLVQLSRADREGRRKEAIAALTDRAKTNAFALKQLSWVYLSDDYYGLSQPGDITWVFKGLVEQNPNDAEARLAIMVYASFRQGLDDNNSTPRDFELAGRQFDWLIQSRPETAWYLSEYYFQILANVGRSEEIPAYIRKMVESAQTKRELETVVEAAGDHLDAALLSKVLQKQLEFEQNSPVRSSGDFSSDILQASLLSALAEERKWDQFFERFREFMELPSATGGIGIGSSAGGPFGPIPASSTDIDVDEFPSPTRWLDIRRLNLLDTAWNAVSDADQKLQFLEWITETVEGGRGAHQEVWLLCQAVLDWKTGNRSRTLQMLADFAASHNEDVGAQVLLANAYAENSDLRRALQAMDGISAAFGSGAKKVEQRRLLLSVAAGDDRRGQLAVDRLVAMRLSADEQSELAETIANYGFETNRGHLLMRAIVTAGKNAQQLHRLMVQTAAMDPARSVDIARRILAIPRSHGRYRSSDAPYREAVEVLMRSGRLDAVATDLERRFSAAPRSIGLADRLLDLYEFSGRTKQLEAVLERIEQNLADNGAYCNRLAERFLVSKQPEYALRMLDCVWQHAPRLILHNGNRQFDAYLSEIADAYAQRRRLPDLADRIRGLDAGVLADGYGQHLIRFAGQTTNRSVDARGALEVHRAVLDVIPDRNRLFALRQYGVLLCEQGTPDEIAAFFRDVPLVSGGDRRGGEESVPLRIWHNGEEQQNLQALVNLAEKSGCLIQLEENVRGAVAASPDWAPAGELLQAMLERRRGDDAPLTELSRRVLAQHAREQEFFDEVLLRELSACESPDALQQGIDLYRADLKTSLQEEHDLEAILNPMTELWIKLGRQEDGRDEFLQLFETSRTSGDITAEEVQQLVQLARAVDRLGFARDALEAVSRIIEPGETLIQAIADRPRGRGLFSTTIVAELQKGRPLRRSLLRQLSQAPPAMLYDQLLAELDRDAPRLARFFAVAEPPAEKGDDEDTDPLGWLTDNGDEDTPFARATGETFELLPAILEYAMSSGQLEELARRTREHRAALPASGTEDLRTQLDLLSLRIALTGGASQSAQAGLKEWVLKAESHSYLAARSEFWGLARAAANDEATQPQALRLAMAAARGAVTVEDEARRYAALRLAARLCPPDVAAAGELFHTENDDLPLRYAFVQACLANGRFPDAIELLAPVWEQQPKLLLDDYATVIEAYADTGRVDLLVEHLGRIRQPAALRDESARIIETFWYLPHDQTSARQILPLYRACERLLAKTGASGYKPELAEQVFDYFGQEWVNRVSLAACEEMAFSGEMRRHSAKLIDRLDYYADELDLSEPLRQRVEQALDTEAIPQHDGELLLALIAVHEGDERPLVAYARRFRDNPQGFGDSTEDVLRNRLSECKGTAALEAAYELWNRQRSQESGTELDATKTVADLLVKLNRPDEARTLLLQALYRPLAISQLSRYDNRQVLRLQFLREIAFALAETGAYFDALDVHARIVELGNHVALGRLQQYLESCNDGACLWIRQGLDESAEPLLDALMRALSSENVEAELVPFVTSFDLRSEDHPRSDDDQFALLPALLNYARESGQLHRVADAVSAARREHPEGLRLRAVEILTALEAGRFDDAASGMLMFAETLEADLVPRERLKRETWLAVQAALKFPETQPLGWRMARELLHGTQSGNDTVADVVTIDRAGRLFEALMLSLSNAEDSAAAEAELRWLAEDWRRFPERQVPLVLASMHHADFSAIQPRLDELWRDRPGELLRHIDELLPAGIERGGAAGIVRGLQSVGTLGLRRNYSNKIVEVIRTTGLREDFSAAMPELYSAARDFVIDDSNLVTVYRDWDNYLVRAGETGAAWELARSAVFGDERPAPLWPLSTMLVDRARDAGRTNEFEASVRAFTEAHPERGAESELLRAMLARREGRREPFDELIRKYAADPQFAEALSPAAEVLRGELSEFDSKDGLQIALRLWRDEARMAAREVFHGGVWEPLASVASICTELGRRDEARELYRRASDRLRIDPANDDGYSTERFDHRRKLGDMMLADRAYMQVVALFLNGSSEDAPADDRARPWADESAAENATAREAVRRAITGHLDETLSELQNCLDREDFGPELAPFFAVTSPGWTAEESSAFPAELKDPYVADLQLLPAVIIHAQSTDRLEPLARRATILAERSPTNPRIVALAALIELSRGRAGAAEPYLQSLIRRTQRVPAFIKTDAARLVAKSVRRYANMAPAAADLYNRIYHTETRDTPSAN